MAKVMPTIMMLGHGHGCVHRSSKSFLSTYKDNASMSNDSDTCNHATRSRDDQTSPVSRDSLIYKT